ncbi:MAG TPA: hypothetical protein VLE93_01115 [Candidatus Saccharimonadales bacterium]|nr:hypothetical protein [Candidatus Saccharimonadales bacterium]
MWFRKRLPEPVNTVTATPIPNSVAILVVGLDDISREDVNSLSKSLEYVSDDRKSGKHWLEKQGLSKGLRIIPVPLDWVKWRLSRKIGREVRPTDPELIIEAEIGSYTPRKNCRPWWSVRLRVFYPDGRQKSATVCRTKDFNQVSSVAYDLALADDLARSADILFREVSADAPPS